MRNQLWIATSIGLLGAAACNETVGDCYPVGQSTGNGDPGGGVISNGAGAGPSGDVPTGQAQEALTMDQCNATDQSSPGMPANAYINCKARGLSPQACSFACGEVGAACGSVAAHPFLLGQGTGVLTYCKNGGPTYTCTFTFPSGEGCTVIVTPVGQRWLCVPPG